MKNKKAYILINILFAFLLGNITTAAALSVYEKIQKPQKLPLFLYGGAVDYTEWIDGYGVDPVEFTKPLKSIALYSAPINLSGAAAAKIGIAVLASKYGRNYVNDQKPFKVSIINGKIWEVKGNPNNKEHASSEIFIQKADAQILRIIRNSN